MAGSYFMSLVFFFLLIKYNAVFAELDCSLCGNGTTMGTPTRNLTWSTFVPTMCGEFEHNYNRTITNAQGEEQCASDSFWLDMAAYCACEGYTKPFTCSFCEFGTLINPDNVTSGLITAPDGSNFTIIGLSCKDAYSAAEYVTSENTCTSMNQLMSSVCCAKSNCSICPPGSTIQNPNKSMVFMGGDITCQVGEDILSGLDAESCDSAMEKFRQFPFDVSAWCECSGSVGPSNACALCSRTPGGDLVNADLVVDLGNNLNVTCLEADQLAPYITDVNVCKTQYEIAISECCTGVPTSPVAPPPTIAKVSSPAPTFAVSTAWGGTIVQKHYYYWTWGLLTAFTFLFFV